MIKRLIIGLLIVSSCFGQEAFLERLKKISEETAARTEKAAEETKLRVEKVSEETSILLERDVEEITKKIQEQSDITAAKIHLTVENLQKAFAGYPLIPIPNDVYYKAVFDAQKTGYNSQPLISITPWNKKLIWMDSQQSHVLMVSWMSKWAADKYYRPALGKVFNTPTFRGTYCWVTAVPEIKEFAQKYQKNPMPGISLQQRIEQFLGLPPGLDERYFVEMWVRPQDLFRSCYNPEIVNTSCMPDPDRSRLSLSFQEIYKEYDTDCDRAPVCKAHKNWFNELKEKQYVGPLPFPWTRVGYTYDWGTAASPIGATEFVIKQGMPVIIHSITPTNEYPQLPDTPSKIN